MLNQTERKKIGELNKMNVATPKIAEIVGCDPQTVRNIISQEQQKSTKFDMKKELYWIEMIACQRERLEFEHYGIPWKYVVGVLSVIDSHPGRIMTPLEIMQKLRF